MSVHFISYDLMKAALCFLSEITASSPASILSDMTHNTVISCPPLSPCYERWLPVGRKEHPVLTSPHHHDHLHHLHLIY